MWRAARTTALLARCLTGQNWCQPDRALQQQLVAHDPDELAHAAAAHGVPGYLLHAVRAAPGAAPLRRALEPVCNQGVRVHLQAMAGLALLTEVLTPVTAWLVVKGPVLAHRAHPRPDLRTYGDLDIVVPAARFPAALAALEAAGASALVADWTHVHAVMAGEVPLRLPTGGQLDLHWHLFNDPATRAAFPVRMPELFAHACPMELGGRAITTLDRADTLLTTALHTCLSGADRLVWLKDLDGLVAGAAPSWDVLFRRAGSAHAELVVAAMLDKTRRLLGTCLGRDLEQRLVPHRTWLAALATADRFGSAHPLTGRGSASRLVARATRHDLRSSLRVLSAHSARWLRPRVRRRSPAPPAAEAADARRRYLTAVTDRD